MIDRQQPVNMSTLEERILAPNPRYQLDRELLEDLLKKLNNSAGEETLKSGLCGFPIFCSTRSPNSCFEKTLSQCQDCSMDLVGVLIAIYIIMGILILLGNGLVLWNVLSKKKGFQDIYSKIRGSLAFADFLTGVLIFAIILPNLIWTVQKTPNQINLQQLASEGSLQAIAGGFFFILGFTSSLYHLALLSIQRLYAIVFPLKYKLQSQKSIITSLVVVWILAALSAIFPAWFPKKLVFAYHPNLFLYMAFKITPSRSFNNTHLDSNTGNYVAESVVLSIFVVLPFLLVTIMSISTGIWISRYYNTQFRRLTAKKSNSKQQSSSREIRIIKTIFFMQIGFIITIAPMITAFSLVYGGVLNCDEEATPVLICLILSISNSMVNVLIYAGTDNKFRKSISDVLKKNSQQSSSFKMSKTRSIKSEASTKPFSLSVTSIVKCFPLKVKVKSHEREVEN